MKHIIRKMKMEDIPQVHGLGISQGAFKTENGAFWSIEQLEDWVNSSTDVLIVVEHDTEIIGFTLFAGHVPTKKVVWENLYVAPKYQRNGIGSELIRKGLEEVKSLGYVYVMGCVNADDQESFAGYVKKFGFKDSGKVTWIDKVL